MKLLEILTDYFSHPAEKTVDKTPNGICALCWGHERYDGKIREMFKDKQIDVNNHRARYMLIQEFLANHVEGPKLKQAYTKDCDECKNKI